AAGKNEGLRVGDQRRAAPERLARTDVDGGDVAVAAAARLRVRLVCSLDVDDATGLSREEHLLRDQVSGTRGDVRRPRERGEVERVPDPVRPCTRTDEVARAGAVPPVDEEDDAWLTDDLEQRGADERLRHRCRRPRRPAQLRLAD